MNAPAAPLRSGGPDSSAAPDHDVRALLREYPHFRRMWLSLMLSSFGDWLGMLAKLGTAAGLTVGDATQTSVAVSTVFILQLAPAALLGPLAGALADRLDRRLTMVVGDVLRFALFASIPLVGSLTWLFVATLLIELVTLFWGPAKDATVPNLVPPNRLEAANQISLVATYGSAPVAGLAFILLTLLTGVLDNVLPFLAGGQSDLAMYVNAVTFLVAAAVIWRLDIPPRVVEPRERGLAPTLGRDIVEGWKFVGATPLLRGLVFGMLVAFAAGGVVLGLGRAFVTSLGAGDPGYGVVVMAVFFGVALGVWQGPRWLSGLSRRRTFALALSMAGVALVLVALVHNIVVASLFVVALGLFTGLAYVSAYTLLGLEVDDTVRGRTFSFVGSSTRVVIIAVMLVAPWVANFLGDRTIAPSEHWSVTYSGAALAMVLAGIVTGAAGFLAYRQMDDQQGTSLREDLVRAFSRRGEPAADQRPADQRPADQPGGPARDPGGFFLALEGGDGSGKTTQARLLARWLEGLGHEAVVSREPGGTATGRQLREVLLAHRDDTTPLSPRAEALLFAADRAQHVAEVVRPGLARGAVVVTDRYVDSSLAYQGAGRDLPAAEVERLSQWATQGLLPDLTVVLDVDPVTAAARRAGRAAEDRMEAESRLFHARVREQFLLLAARDPQRYLVLDATTTPETVHAKLRAHLEALLPAPATAPAAAPVAEPAPAPTRTEAGSR